MGYIAMRNPGGGGGSTPVCAEEGTPAAEGHQRLGASKLADFFEMAEAAKVLAAIVPMSTLTERDVALRWDGARLPDGAVGSC
jgi:hypothetical protein